MSYGGEVVYSFVKVKVIKASKPTLWYANYVQGKDMIGKTVEVRKREITTEHGTTTAYEYLDYKDEKLPHATYYFDNNDVEEIKN